MCGLIYQVLWLRLLSLIFGVTVYAASTVLAAFMAGLAVGSFLAAPLLKRSGRPLVVFGIAEILIGLSALATPLELNAASAVYRWLHHQMADSLGVLTMARLLSGFLVLLVPTILMGLTLPTLSASTLVRGSRFGSRVGALYGVNTAGAVFGAGLTGFYLIGALGIQRAFFVGAAINIAVGIVALILARQISDPPVVTADVADEASATTALPISPAVVGTVIFISGLAALALEIVWFRMLVQFLPATTYAFTTMLATVLAGIAIGGVIGARLLRRERDWVPRLALLQLGTGLAVLVSCMFLSYSYAAGWRTGADLPASVAAILPAAILMGIAFPVAMRIGASSAGNAEGTARRVGRLYGLNVVGAIVGALVGGFALLPLLGVRRALIAMAGLYAASSLLVVCQHPARRRLLAITGVGLALFAWVATRVPDPVKAAYQRRHGRDMLEYWREEGVQTAVSVHASQFRRALFLDGLHQANDTNEMVQLHRAIGHLPMVLHPNPRRALVIGLGGGATAGAVSQYPGASVQVVELSDSVRRAAVFFAHVNYDVINQPNVRLRTDDGRNFLLLSGERFDVITADIIQPVHAGAGNLYSREYFHLVRNALEDGGIALQWIGHRPLSQYRLIMRTFLDVFADATLWLDGNLMVGSTRPLRLQAGSMAFKRTNPQIRAALDDIGLNDFAILRSWYTAGPEEMRRFVGEGPVLTDDRPLVEYHRSLPRDDVPFDISSLKGDVARIISP